MDENAFVAEDDDEIIELYQLDKHNSVMMIVNHNLEIGYIGKLQNEETTKRLLNEIKYGYDYQQK